MELPKPVCPGSRPFVSRTSRQPPAVIHPPAAPLWQHEPREFSPRATSPIGARQNHSDGPVSAPFIDTVSSQAARPVQANHLRSCPELPARPTRTVLVPQRQARGICGPLLALAGTGGQAGKAGKTVRPGRRALFVNTI